MEKQKQELERSLELAVERSERLVALRQALAKRRENIRRLEVSLAEASLVETESAAEVRRFRREAEVHARRQEKDFQPQIDSLDAQLEEPTSPSAA